MTDLSYLAGNATLTEGIREADRMLYGRFWIVDRDAREKCHAPDRPRLRRMHSW